MVGYFFPAPLGGILTNPIGYLKKGHQPIALENGINRTAQSYDFRKRALHSTSRSSHK